MKIAVAAIALVCLGGLCSTSVAQTDTNQSKIETLVLKEVEVRSALEALFAKTGMSYSVDPKVQGTVTVSFHNVTLEAALKNILLQVDARSTVEDGIYRILPQAPVDNPPAAGKSDSAPVPNGKVRRRVKVQHADPQLIGEQLSPSGTQDYTQAPERSTVIALDKFLRKGGFSSKFGGG